MRPTTRPVDADCANKPGRRAPQVNKQASQKDRSVKRGVETRTGTCMMVEETMILTIQRGGTKVGSQTHETGM